MSITSTRASDVYDVAVIGGGPAGSVAAIHLARAGFKVAIYEKSDGKDLAAKHKVCGEFISAEGIAYLEEIGIDLDSMGASIIENFRLHGLRSSGEARLPAQARGLSRSLLDETLLAQAARAGADVFRGVSVKELVWQKPFELKTTQGSWRVERVVCATGKSEFRSVQSRPGRDSGLVGFKFHLRLSSQARVHLNGGVDLFVFKDGYGGLSLVEGGLANFCFLIEREKARSTGRDWSTIVTAMSARNPALKEYLVASDAVFARPATVASVPYGFICSGIGAGGLHGGKADDLYNRVYCVGDQLAVIPSLTGDGMTIAFMSGYRAAEAIRRGIHAELFHSRMASLLKSQIDLGYRFHQLFRHPGLCDIGAYLLRRFPVLLNSPYRRTRITTSAFSWR